MTGPFAGVRGRVTFSVLAVASCLYSLLGAVGFLQIANSGRNAIRERVTEVVDQLEASLEAGGPTVSINTPDGVTAFAVAAGSALPRAFSGEIRVERDITVGGTPLHLVGHASQAPLTESLHSLFRGLWIAIPAAAVITALLAGLATRRALRPVGNITRLAETIGGNDTDARVPVPDTGDEIARLARTVNEMLDRIAAGRLAQRRFSSDAAHELRTPLMALQAEIELAQSHPDLIDAGFLGRLNGLAGRLNQRVDDLLLLSILDEGTPLDLRPTSLLDLVRTEAADLSPSIEVTGSPAIGSLDPVLVGRAVRNLLANARRHARSRIEASVAVEGHRIWLHVDDDGPGVAPPDRDFVFRRFARLDEARSADAGGAGLGLSIVASVAAAHHGGVDVTDSPLGGSRFSLWVPQADALAAPSTSHPG